jgi:hypothetical protein
MTDVELGASVHAGDLVMPAGVTMVTENEYGIASIMITRASLSADEGVEADGGDEAAGEAGAAESEGE